MAARALRYIRYIIIIRMLCINVYTVQRRKRSGDVAVENYQKTCINILAGTFDVSIWLVHIVYFGKCIRFYTCTAKGDFSFLNYYSIILSYRNVHDINNALRLYTIYDALSPL